MRCVRILPAVRPRHSSRRAVIVYRKEHQYYLSRLGRLLLERHDNARLLAKGVARAKRTSYLRCNGGRWLRCRCEKFWVAGHEKIRVPFPLGQWLTIRIWRKMLG